MEGTFINAAAVIVGSFLGLLIHSKLPERIVKISFQAIGLFTLFLGFNMASETQNFMVIIFSIVLGSIIGETIKLEKQINGLSNFLKNKLKSKNQKFTEGLITAFLLFCVGSMAILGSIEEGLGGEPNLLLAKSVLDGFSSLALSSSLGVGVIFAVVPMVIYQGGITLFAGYLNNFFTEAIIAELTAVGGLLLIGLGLSLLEIKKIKVVNMLPSLVMAIILAYLL